ncbi:MAG TPA: 16S rRNA (guanine(966)-N(2))-methyltransferase RsmD [bacterium]|nr:16S rRNA (guanine(966)-N(2))-methyltransferase RsmD [bacterium]HOL35368.1 16S rRNA (guanine(966)-N(2))-methyltransferase RsmD [bacterium]HPP08847.1 16S rRNA (guanine(966)-N(2))-methyltransferase RsmD [bacterium]
MKITGGYLKGRTLFYNKKPELRPTRGIVKKAIFDMLAPYISHSRILELFAGTGAIGFEALSRGAESVVFVDNNVRSIKLLEKNCKFLDVKERVRIVKTDAQHALTKFQKKHMKFDMIFADPPYHLSFEKIQGMISTAVSVLVDGGFFVLESAKIKKLFEDLQVSGFVKIKEKVYGSTRVQIYQKRTADCCISRKF